MDMTGPLAAASAAAAAPPPPPPATRTVESRRELYGLLWFPTLTVKDADRTIVAASAGRPHCARCVRALALNPGPPEEWSCSGCSERRPGTTADLQVTDAVIAETLREHLARHPDYRAAAGLAAPGRR